MARKVTIVGRGLVGRAWAITFARAGWDVAFTGRKDASADAAWEAIDANLQDLEELGQIDSAADVRGRIQGVAELADAIDGADMAIECVPENVDIKRELFGRMDALAGPETILCSSTSAITTSQLSEGFAGKHRIIVTHPCNPPSFLRVVEVSPAPWTAPEVTARCSEIMESVGKSVCLLKKEIMGFILNRLHIALVVEGLCLVDQGYVSADDLEKVVKDGIGPRWAFMGPFETLDLNANGFNDVMGYFGDLMKAMYPDREWRRSVVDEIDTARRATLPLERIPDRRAWRDRQLMAHDLQAQKAAEEWS